MLGCFRLDANRAWGFEEALAFAEEISGVRVAYVEEPLADPGRLAELAGARGLPVALDESLVGMAPGELGRHPYAAAVVLKPTLLGGVSRTLRLAEEAKAMGAAPVVSSSYEAGVEAMVGLDRIFEPNAHRQKQYASRFEEYKGLWSVVEKDQDPN